MKHAQTYLVLCIVAILMLAGTGSSTAQESDPISIIFMHHSTGENLIWQGGVREGLTEHGYTFWDHGYNDNGLTGPDGINTGINWDVPGDNTDPDGWYETFQQPVTDPPSNTFSHMLQHDVIIFKSCFPSSHIYDEDMFETYQHYYLTIRDVIDQHPDKLFIPWTTPPLVPNETDAEAAARARRWAAYLVSDEYLEGHPNIAVFDVNSLWSDENGYLRAEYRMNEWDSHPNEYANQTVGPMFVEFIHEAIMNFEPGDAPPPPPATDGDEEDGDDADDTTMPAMEPGEPVAAGPFEDFEGEDFGDWWWDFADQGVVFSCTPGSPGYESNTALTVVFDSPAERYGGCGLGFEMMQNWSETSGLRMVWRSSTPGVQFLVVVWVEDPTQTAMEGTTPFDAFVEAPGNEWGELVILWEDFVKAEWLGDAGIDELDLTRITGISFEFGDWDNAQMGEIWIDDLGTVE